MGEVTGVPLPLPLMLTSPEEASDEVAGDRSSPPEEVAGEEVAGESIVKGWISDRVVVVIGRAGDRRSIFCLGRRVGVSSW